MDAQVLGFGGGQANKSKNILKRNEKGEKECGVGKGR